MSIFSRFTREPLELQLYGKLPLAKDYLRVSMSQGGARELREWMDRAYSSEVGTEGAEAGFRSRRFLVGCYEGEALLGVLWPSSDEGGKRKFPFCMAVARRRRVLASEFAKTDPRLNLLWQEIETHFGAAETCENGREFLSKLRGKALEGEAKPNPPGPRAAWEAWCERLFPGREAEGIVDLLVELLKLGQENHRGPWRFPILSELEVGPQVYAWASALREAGAFTDRDVPTVFFPAGVTAAPGSDHVTFFRDPLASDTARWLAPVRAGRRLGRGDFGRSEEEVARPHAPVPENGPLLVDSLRGALATARAKAQ